ncbi:MAG: rhomboid family intramembrane serine protease [Armatimonadetes bacterium]|nr:rhomboid family intramembrane serine protease [Armatimonadota bacterium]
MSAKSTNRFFETLKKTPFVTVGIIAINCLVTYLARRDMSLYETYVLIYGLVPEQFRVGRLLTATFIHDGWVHLALNMSALYLFGREVERAMGLLEYIMFYIGACFASSLLHVLISLYAIMPSYYASRAMVGASGAVAGVMGIYAVRFHRRVFHFAGMCIPALILIMAWLVIQLSLGIIGLYRDEILGIGLKQVGYWSHLGGFGFGIAVALLANMALTGEREYLVNEAKRYDSDGNLLEAIAHHETILKYDPDNADSHAEIARLWALLDEKEDSIRCYQVAIELYVSQGKEDRALAVAEEMKRFWPSSRLSPSTRFRLATYLDESGETDRALEAFRRIAEDEPQSVEAQMSLLKIGQLQLSTVGDPRLAEETLSVFLERYPSSEWSSFASELLSRARQSIS